jgi:ribose transport system ATP-binding protein
MALPQATNISKRFSGVAALQEISFAVNSGEIHALLSENGAG